MVQKISSPEADTKSTPEAEKLDGQILDGQIEEDERLDPQRTSWRFGAIAIFFVTATLLIIVRLISYQLFPNQGADALYAAPAASPARGSIVDRDGNILSIDRYFYDISATPENLSDEEMREVASKVAELTGMDAAAMLETLVENEERPYCLLAKGLTLDETRTLMSFLAEVDQASEYSPFEYVHISASPERYYPEGKLAAHIMGFVGIDVATNSGRAGHYGLESYYDRYLSQNGVGLPTNANATLNDLPRETVRYLPSLPRKDLVLTIDRGMQWIAEEELDYALRYFRAQSGSIIAMDPRSGEILALANLPTFDPNEYATEDSESFSNSTVNLQYEPGSIFKVITMAAALDTGIITSTTVLTDTGSISVGGRVFLNSNRQAYGKTTIADALARSLNVITVQVAQLLGDDEFYHYVRRFGFGQPTGVDLAGEVSGLLKSPGDPTWSVSDLAANSFGQGLAVTPLQMLSAVATLANDGLYMRPYVVDARVAGSEVLFTEPMARTRSSDTRNRTHHGRTDGICRQRRNPRRRAFPAIQWPGRPARPRSLLKMATPTMRPSRHLLALYRQMIRKSWSSSSSIVLILPLVRGPLTRPPRPLLASPSASSTTSTSRPMRFVSARRYRRRPWFPTPTRSRPWRP